MNRWLLRALAATAALFLLAIVAVIVVLNFDDPPDMTEHKADAEAAFADVSTRQQFLAIGESRDMECNRPLVSEMTEKSSLVCLGKGRTRTPISVTFCVIYARADYALPSAVYNIDVESHCHGL